MAKITLPSVASGNNISTVNNNFQTIATELNDKVLYRDPPFGEPNQMKAPLDMNGNRILNLPKPVSSLEPVRKIDIVDTSTVDSEIIAQAVEDATNAASAASAANLAAQISAVAASNYATDAADNSRLSIGTVLTGAPGSNAQVTIEGDPGEQILNFVIPRGASSTGVGTKLRIVVLGDSMTARQAGLDEVWPDALASNLRAAGQDCEVFNLAVNGATHYSAMTDMLYGGKSQVSMAIDYAPDVVIIALGINDGYRAESVGIPGVISEASLLYSSLHAALPDATLVYASETFYDKVHGTPSTLTNEQTFPIFANPRTTGILAYTYCPEIMPEAASVPHKNAVTAWVSLDTAIKGFGYPWFELPLWQACRLGLTQSDAFHINYGGHRFVAQAAFKWCQSYTSVFPNVGLQGVNAWNDWNSAFNSLLESNGTRYVNKTPSGSDAGFVCYWGPWNTAIRERWYSQSKASVLYDVYQNNYVKTQNIWGFTITGGLPGSEVFQSSNDGAWQSIGNLDSRGNFRYSIDFAGLGVPNGTYSNQIRIANDVFPKFTFTVSGTPYAKENNIPMTGITQEGATTGQVITWNGTRWAPGSGSSSSGKAYIVADGDINISSASPTVQTSVGLTGVYGNGMTPQGSTYYTGVTVPRAGRYLFTYQGMFVGSGGAGIATLTPSFMRNGTGRRTFGTYNNKGGSTLAGFNCALIVDLNAGDLITTWVNIDVANAVITNTSADKWWSWSLVEL